MYLVRVERERERMQRGAVKLEAYLGCLLANTATMLREGGRWTDEKNKDDGQKDMVMNISLLS